jgi:hypothetical protein
MKIQEKTAEELKLSIEQAVLEIKEKRKSPIQTKIGKLFGELLNIDEGLYRALMADYKPIATEYFSTKRGREEKIIIEADRAARAEVLAGEIAGKISRGGGGKKELSDTDLMSGPSSAREGRVRASKPAAKKLPKPARPKGDRDRQNFKFRGAEYGKGKLVHAIIKFHVEKNPKITVQQLKAVFPDHLLKGYGLIRPLAEALEISKQHKRFFLKEEHLIKCSGGVVAVCNQFSCENIKPFFEHAKKLGYEIEPA